MLSQQQIETRRHKRVVGSRKGRELAVKLRLAVNATIMECLAEGLSLRDIAEVCKCSPQHVSDVKKAAGW